MSPDEQEIAARMTCETARHVVIRRLAQAAGLRRIVELAEQADVGVTAPSVPPELAESP